MNQGFSFGDDRNDYQIYVRFDLNLRSREDFLLLKLAQSIASAKITGIYNKAGEEVFIVDEDGFIEEWSENEPYNQEESEE